MEYDLEWLYDIFILEFWHAVSIILAVFFICYICLNARRTALFYHYVVLQIILLNWLISKVFKTVAPTAELKWLFILAQYATVCFLGSAVLMFGYRYATGRTLPARISIPLNIPPLFFFLVLATNEKHHLFYTTYEFLGDTFGPLFYAYSAMTYLYIIVGLYFCATQFAKNPGAKRIESRLLVAGIVIPLFFNALYVGGLMQPRFDITPVTYNLSLLLFAYAVYKHRFLDVVPAGVSMAFHNLREGVLVFDADGRALDKNEALVGILGLDKGAHYETVTEIAAAGDYSGRGGNLIAKAMDALREREDVETVGEIADTDGKTRYLTVRIRPAKPFKNSPWGYVCLIHDNTAYLELIRELEEKNRQLARANKQLAAYGADLERSAVMEERNRMAKEIHDVLGHSLVLVLKILEASRLLCDRDPAAARAKMDQALAVARTGLSELQRAFGEVGVEQDERPVAFLADALHRLAEEYGPTGVRVEVEMKGSRKRLPATHCHAVNRICQEALTNALKHGRPDKIYVFVRLNPKEVDLYVLDDGGGCAAFQKGRGLAGMEQRVRELGGTFACGAAGEKGFTVHARLPCQACGDSGPPKPGE